MLKIAMERTGELFARMSEAQKLYLPIQRAGQLDFRPYQPGEKVKLDMLKTVKSAKELFFPQAEDLAHFKLDGKKIEINEARRVDEDFVVFGVRACDMASLSDVLDRVFLSDPYDPYYAARREHATIVTLACAQPDDSCFCHSFGIDAHNPGGDASAWIKDKALYIQPNTEKGEALASRIKDLMEQTDETVEKDEAAFAAAPLANLSVDGFRGMKTMDIFDAPEWKKLSAACLGCGACTFVCPTCQCYDIRDYDTGNGVQRYRCWDSCMFSDFTLMAHGNSRKTQLERYRQRFMHKLVYFPLNNDGAFSCVGCGRCVDKCPVNLNIVKVIKALGGKKNAD